MGIAGVAVFIAVALTLPVLKSGYGPVEDPVSRGAIGTWGWLQTSAFLALGLGSAAIAWTLYQRLPGRPGAVAALLVAGWSACIVLAGAFTADPADGAATTSGKLHSLVSVLGFLFVLAGMFAAALAARRVVGWQRHARVAVAWGSLGVVGLAATIATKDSAIWGIVQRAFLAVVMTWLVGAAVTLQGRAPRASLAAPGRHARGA